jgi:hypothetical protein
LKSRCSAYLQRFALVNRLYNQFSTPTLSLIHRPRLTRSGAAGWMIA